MLQQIFLFCFGKVLPSIVAFIGFIALALDWYGRYQNASELVEELPVSWVGVVGGVVFLFVTINMVMEFRWVTKHPHKAIKLRNDTITAMKLLDARGEEELPHELVIGIVTDAQMMKVISKSQVKSLMSHSYFDRKERLPILLDVARKISRKYLLEFVEGEA